MTGTLRGLYRFPVKSLSPEILAAVDLTAGQCLPDDRRFAIAHRESRFDPAAPAWQAKGDFLCQARHLRLIEVRSRYDGTTGDLDLAYEGQHLTASTTTADGRAVIGRFIDAVLDKDLGAELVEAPGVAFTDVPGAWVSLINLASLRALEAVTGLPVDQRRFRGNLVFDGVTAWSEFDWVGKVIAVGDALLHVVEPIGRCVVTTINPDTFVGDINVLKVLMAEYGHHRCGLYAEVVRGGTIRPGVPIRLVS